MYPKSIDMHEGISKALKEITLVFGCTNLFLSPPHPTIGEIAVYATQIVAERATSVGFSWLAELTLNLS